VAVLKEQIAAQAKAIRSGDHVVFFALDEKMHRLILEVSGHPGVWDLIASVKVQLDRVRYLSLEDQAWLTMIFRQHREIVGAIAAHDPARAESAMQQHLRTVFAAIERIASAHTEFFEEEAPKLAEKSA
jgi:DNA-binding GntR family transcriptional regulator